jgi:YD repeat-containing protein
MERQVTRTLILGLLLTCACLSLITRNASAQVSNGCVDTFSCGAFSLGYNTPQGSCNPVPPPGVFNCFSFDWSTSCEIWSFLCPPADGAIDSACGPCGSNGQGGRPINLSTGDVYIKQTDISIPGLGGGLAMVRIWNSMWPSTQTASQVGMFGSNWRSTYEERVFLGSDLYMKYARSDGSFWSFGYQGPGFRVAAPANQNVSLMQGASYWTMTFQDGEQRLFDNTSGNLIAIIDRNGNTTQLAYDATGRLSTITGPASRHLYFTYGSSFSNLLVTSITSDFGVSVSYSYDSQGRLSQVTEPDGSTVSFQYDGNSLITAVLDSQGKILESHTYDNLGRGLTSSEANGVEAVSVNYQ